MATSKDSLQVDRSLCNSMSHRVYGKCRNCGNIEEKSTEPYVTPQLTEEQRTVSVIYACVKEERIDWAINYLKTYVAQELALQRRELATEAKKLKYPDSDVLIIQSYNDGVSAVIAEVLRIED